MADLINREDAVKAVRNLAVPLYKDPVCSDIFERDRTLDIAIDALIALPSADPGLDEWCTDCKEYDQERHCCPRWNRVIRETLNDMPKRETGKWMNYFHVPINKFLSLKRNKDLYWVCSNCGYMSLYINTDITYNFCPCCGADMRGEADG